MSIYDIGPDKPLPPALDWIPHLSSEMLEFLWYATALEVDNGYQPTESYLAQSQAVTLALQHEYAKRRKLGLIPQRS